MMCWTESRQIFQSIVSDAEAPGDGNAADQTLEPAAFDVVTEDLVGNAMRCEPRGIHQIPGGYCIENFLQVLCSPGHHDAYNGIFSKFAPYISLRNTKIQCSKHSTQGFFKENSEVRQPLQTGTCRAGSNGSTHLSQHVDQIDTCRQYLATPPTVRPTPTIGSVARRMTLSAHSRRSPITYAALPYSRKLPFVLLIRKHPARMLAIRDEAVVDGVHPTCFPAIYCLCSDSCGDHLSGCRFTRRS